MTYMLTRQVHAAAMTSPNVSMANALRTQWVLAEMRGRWAKLRNIDAYQRPLKYLQPMMFRRNL